MSRALTFLFILAGIATATGPARLGAAEIALFDYRGDRTQFDILRGVLDQRVANLAAQVFDGTAPMPADGSHLSSFKITAYGADTLANPNQAIRWIDNHGDIVSVLQGTIFPGSGPEFTAFSRFTLAGEIPNGNPQVVTIEALIGPQEFANNRDSHTLMILYCLAKDAKRRGLSPDYISALLKTAKGLLDDIARRSNGPMAPALQAIQADVVSGLGTRAPRCETPCVRLYSRFLPCCCPGAAHGASLCASWSASSRVRAALATA
ncbi:hypothetical protein F3Y30_15315 [Sinorhizobium sp. BG8]|nr:hypothetical protein F3Y30_15315 [Sinorhizobium sp. BG8]